MKVEMTRCDNPGCHQVTDDEAYGWLHVEAEWRGSGPSISIEVCSIACVKSALDEGLIRLEQEELDREISYAQALREAVISQHCERCKAEPGQPCMTKHGVVSQQTHAPRADAARAQLRAKAGAQ